LRSILTQALVRRCALTLVRPTKTILERNIMIRFNLLAILASALAADAAMIFNNGSPDVNFPQSRNMSAFRLADDFILTSAANVASVRFWMVDLPGDFSGSITYAVYQDSAGAIGSLVTNGTATVSGITPVFLSQLLGSTSKLERVDFNLSTPLALAIGTYWLELHNGSSLTGFGDVGDDVSWAMVTGNPAGNAKQNKNQDPLSTDTGSTLAFQLFDNSTGATINAVPEPTTISFIGIGLAALAISRRKRR